MVVVYPYKEKEYFDVINSVQSFRDRLDTMCGITGHGITIKNGYYQLIIDVEDISVASQIPNIINGIETIVNVTGPIVYTTATAESIRSLPEFRCDITYDPIVMGICINGEITPSCVAGTLGAFVKKGGQIVGLTNNHVIAGENAGKIGDPVYHPPRCGAQQKKIGTLGGFELTKFGSGDNYIDAAWFSIDSGTSHNNATRCADNNYSIVGPAIKGSELTLNAPVKKCGARTAYTEGNVTSIDFTTNVNTDHGLAHYIDQIRTDGIDGMMGGGDSGSVWVRKSDNRPVALNFAGPKDAPYNFAIGNKIERVEKILGVSFGDCTDPMNLGCTSGIPNTYIGLGFIFLLMMMRR